MEKLFAFVQNTINYKLNMEVIFKMFLSEVMTILFTLTVFFFNSYSGK